MRKRTLRKLIAAGENAEAEYVAQPGTETLAAWVAAWDRALAACARVPVADDLLDGVTHHAAIAHLHAFRRFGKDEHAEAAAGLLERLRRETASPDLAFAAAADLATLRLGQYFGAGDIGKLRAAVDLHEDVVRRCPDGFEHRPVLLGNLGNALVELNRRDVTCAVLGRAIQLHEEAVASAPPAAAYRPALLVNLATALVARHQRDAEVTDLERAAALHEEIAESGPHDELVAIARAELLWERYALSRDDHLLDELIFTLEGVVSDLPEDVPSWLTAAANLANALLERQSRSGVEARVSGLLDRALAVAPEHSPERPRIRHVQGMASWQEYLRTGDLSRLQAALDAWREAAASVAATDPVRPHHLNSVAIGLLQRSGHLGERQRADADADADAAVAAAREAIAAAPEHAPVTAILWNTLGRALATRHPRSGHRRDILDAVEAWRTAVALTPSGSAVAPSHLASLAVGLRERAAVMGGTDALDDLREAVALHREAIAALAGSQELPGQLTNLGMTLQGLAAQAGDPASYVAAQQVFREAVERGRQVSPGQALDAALAWHRMAVDAVPDWPDAAAAADAALAALRTLLATQLAASSAFTSLQRDAREARGEAPSSHVGVGGGAGWSNR